jgi:ribosome-associated translation inhibitor RaiA
MRRVSDGGSEESGDEGSMDSGNMNPPLEITFQQLNASPALVARIRKLMARLERFSSHIMRCHVVVEAAHRHHHQGNLFDVRIDITTPGAQFSIQRASARDHAHEDPYVALRDAYRAARRRLQDYERERRGAVKQHRASLESNAGLDVGVGPDSQRSALGDLQQKAAS